MPEMARVFVHTAWVFWVLGTTLGCALLLQKAVPVWPQLWAWLPLHYEFLVWGWLLQFIFGVAYWILPGKTGETPSRLSRLLLSTAWIGAMFFVLNTSLLLRVFSIVWRHGGVSASGDLLEVACEALRILAVTGFFFHVLARLSLYEQVRRVRLGSR